MRTRLTDRNTLQRDIEMGQISTHSRWTKIACYDDFEFPELSLNDFRPLFVGTYKLKQAQPYTEEHMNQQDDYIIKLESNNDDIVRCTIQSRHSNRTKYKCRIKYSLPGEPIHVWYYTCISGAITVGACSHVVSVVWYLSYARYNNFQLSKSRHQIQQAVMERVVEDIEASAYENKEETDDDDQNDDVDDDNCGYE